MKQAVAELCQAQLKLNTTSQWPAAVHCAYLGGRGCGVCMWGVGGCLY